MASDQLIRCPYCGYKYHTNIDDIIRDGEAFALRSIFKNPFSQKIPKLKKIDLTCPNPNCNKEFKWEIKV